MTINQVTILALSFPEVEQSPHFEKTSFRIRKKIFATLDQKKSTLVVKLSIVDQSVFCDMICDYVQPVPGAWGKKGWTSIQYEFVKEEGVKDLLRTAYIQVAPKSLSSNLQ